MKKRILIGILGVIVIGSGFYFANKEQVRVQSVQKFADVRLASYSITKELELKIAFLVEDITKNRAMINDKELKAIIAQIKIIRAYKKDISLKAKTNLLKIIKVLATKHYPNKKLLLQLLDVVESTQNLNA